MAAEKTITHRGFTIEIHRDDDSSVNDALGGGVTLFAWHRRYSFGSPPPAWADEARHEGDDALCAAIIEHQPNVVILPVFMHEHSGIALSTGAFACPFDSGQLGVIFAPLVDHEPGASPEEARRDTEAMLRAVIEEANERAQGNVWGYVIRSPEGDKVGSCWGYVGDPESESFLDDAFVEIQCEIERRQTGETLVAESFAL